MDMSPAEPRSSMRQIWQPVPAQMKARGISRQSPVVFSSAKLWGHRGDWRDAEGRLLSRRRIIPLQKIGQLASLADAGGSATDHRARFFFGDRLGHHIHIDLLP